MVDFEKMWERVKDKPNVWGCSQKLRPKIVDGEETEEESFRIYVHEKVDEKYLHDEHIVPKEIEGIKTDIVETEQPEAPPSGLEAKPKKREKTDRIRPVIYGISIGNWKITAGTNGAPYKGDEHNYLFGSNAHVFTPDPSMSPEEVRENETRIVQPGKYDDGTLEDLVANYLWHKQINPSGSRCPVGKIWAGIFNSFSKLLGRKTRLKPVTEEPNRIDFSVALPEDVGYETEFYDDLGKWENLGTLGHWFAGSRQVATGCKIKYIIKEGYEPLVLEPTAPKMGMKVGKSGRTTCEKWGKITDDSATARVRYGTFVAEFEDIFMAEPILKGGDSGSCVVTRP